MVKAQAVRRTDAERQEVVDVCMMTFMASYERNHRGPVLRGSENRRRSRARDRAEILVSWCLDKPVTEHG